MSERRSSSERAGKRQSLPCALLLSSLPLLGAPACSEAGPLPSPREPEAAAGASGLPEGSGGQGPTGTAGTGPGAAEDPPNEGDALETVAGVTCGEVVCSAFSSCGSVDSPTECRCAPGLLGDGQRCVDIDECATEPDRCGAHGSCRNGFGSYSCSCDPGYWWNGTGCVDVDECEHDPCAASALCSNDAQGGFTCACAAGSFGDGFFCSPTDACAGDPCGDDGACVNVPDVSGGSGYACQCQPGSAGDQACSPCGEHLVLSDPALRTAVNRQLGRAQEDASPIPLGALSGMTLLDASGLGVHELTGLSCWPALERLNLSHNPGFVLDANAAELSQLNRLTELHLDCTGSTSLNAVATHAALRVLSVNVVHCETPTLLDDAAAVGRLPGLESLDLGGQGLGSVQFLSGARNLRRLRLGHNQLRSAEELGNLPLLHELDLNSNGLESLEGVAGLLALQTLNVPLNQLRQLEPTASLSQLQVINASDNALSSLPDWQHLQQLREVTVSGNQLSDIATLAGLPMLHWVNFAENQIDSLSPLVDGSLQGTLVVAGNPLPCSVEAAHITALRARGVDVKGNCEP
jgi:hypothetical protein